MKCSCGGKSNVTTTEQKPNGVFRRRKCEVCRTNFATMEMEIETFGTGSRNQYGETRKPKALPVVPKPDERGLYATDKDVAAVKMKKVDVRRKNEDIREKMRVPSYFIEDDEGDDDVERWKIY